MKKEILLIFLLLLVACVLLVIYACLKKSKQANIYAEKYVDKAIENAKISHGHGTEEQ